MKTYAQANGEQNFDWNKFLEREIITEEEWSYAKSLAESWVTCACGNQCNIIPRANGVPVDSQLSVLGGLFAVNIASQDRLSAIQTLHAIETRSAELIKELVSNHQRHSELKIGIA